MIPYQWTSAIIAITLAGAIIWLVRYNQLHPRNATWWLLVALVVAVVGIVPGFVDYLARELGVHYPPTLAVLAGMAVILIKLLKTDIERSREQQQIRILAQKVAVLEEEVRDARARRGQGSADRSERLQSASR